MTGAQPNIVERLRAAGHAHEALELILGRSVPADRTTGIRCPDPAGHSRGDQRPSAVVQPSSTRVSCFACGGTWGLLELGVLLHFAATTAEVAQRLDDHYFGAPHRNGSARSAAPPVSGGAAKKFPFYPQVIQTLGWQIVEERGVSVLHAPVYDSTFTQCSVKVRGPRGADGRLLARLDRTIDGRREAGLVNGAALEMTEPGTVVFVTAGETDLLALVHAARAEGIAIHAVSPSNGEGQSLAQLAGAFRALRVAIVYDADAAGRKGAAERVAELRGHAAAVADVLVPFDAAQMAAGCKDLRDWLSRCGGSVRELLRVVEHSFAAPPPGTNAQPVTPRVPVSFPVEALPEPVRAFVAETAAALGCDVGFVVPPVLSVLASAIGNSRVVRLKPDWTEPSVVWAAVVAESGTMKSPAFEKAMAPLKMFQRLEFKRHSEAMAAFAAEDLRHQWAVGQWKKAGCEGEPPTPPAKPTSRRFLVSDTTVEALAAVLADSPRGVLLAREELSGWVRGMGQYKQGRGGDEAHYLEMHGARSLTVDRKDPVRPAIHVLRAAVSISGTIQPEILRAVFDRAQYESGLVSRCLMSRPPRIPKRWTETRVQPATLDNYELVVVRLLALDAGEALDGEPEPLDVELDAEAKAEWVAFYNRHAKRQNAAAGDEAAMLAKIEGTAARLALIHFLVRAAWATRSGAAPLMRIDSESMRAGIRMAEWFADEAERIYGELHQTPDERARDALVGWVRRRGGEVTVRDAARGLRRLRGDEKAAKDALDELVRLGLGAWSRVGTGASGGRPTEAFVLAESPAAAEAATEPTCAGSVAQVVSPSPQDGGSARRGDGDETHPRELEAHSCVAAADGCAAEELVLS